MSPILFANGRASLLPIPQLQDRRRKREGEEGGEGGSLGGELYLLSLTQRLVNIPG